MRLISCIAAPISGKTIKKPVSSAPTAEDLAQKEKDRLEKIAVLESEIVELESSYDGCEDISLIGVQVTSNQYGVGTVVAQDINKISVQFEQVSKTFILDKKYSARPRFENDDEIVEVFTKFAYAKEQIKKLRQQIEALQR